MNNEMSPNTARMLDILDNIAVPALCGFSMYLYSVGWYLAALFIATMVAGMVLYVLGRLVWLIVDIIRMVREMNRREREQMAAIKRW